MLLAQLIFLATLRTATAARAGDDENDALVLDAGEDVDIFDISNYSRWQFAGNTQLICGGSEIWGQLTAGGDLDSAAQNVDWAKMEAYKTAYMTGQTAELKRLKDLMGKKFIQLLDAQKKESMPNTGKKDHQLLVELAVGKTFKGSLVAELWRCGKGKKGCDRGSRDKKCRKPANIRTAYDSSIANFQKEVSPTYFQGKKYRLDGAKFLKDCRFTLMGNAKEEETYCGNLCQQLKDHAQTASNNAFGAAAGVSGKIKEELKAFKEKINKLKESIEQCETDWSSIATFKDQLMSLKATYDKSFKTFMDADQSMADLEWDLMDLQDKVTEQDEELAKAKKELTGKTAATNNAKKALDDADAKEKSLKGKVEKLSLDLSELKKKLSNAQDASGKLGKLKEYVTNTMLVMSTLADDGLREPLRNLGFDDSDPKVFLEAFPDPKAAPGAKELQDALGALHSFCGEKAMPVFTEIKQVAKLDMTPMCALTDVNKDFADLSAQVQIRANKIQSDITKVLEWLNPWKVYTGVSEAEGRKKEDENVKKGQLAYMDQVRSVYGGAGWTYNYLKEWRLGGNHQKLITNLKAAIDKLAQKETEFTKTLADAKAAWETAKKAREDALKKLEEAKTAEAKAAGNTKALEKTIAELKEEGIKLNREFDDWMAKLEKAKKELAAAKQALVSTYSTGTGKGLIEVETRGQLHWSHLD